MREKERPRRKGGSYIGRGERERGGVRMMLTSMYECILTDIETDRILSHTHIHTHTRMHTYAHTHMHTYAHTHSQTSELLCIQSSSFK